MNCSGAVSIFRSPRVLVAALLLTFAIPATAEVGVTDKEIVIGSTGSLTGHNAALGTMIANGQKAYFRRLNAAGGVHGRTIKFLPMDDGYEPVKAVQNVRVLLDEVKVFALVGGNGTPIAQAIMPQVEKSGLPFLFTQTGGDIMFPQPPKQNLFQVRVSYSDEAAGIVKYAIEKLHLKSIGVLYQDDAFGSAGRAGVVRALGDHQLKPQGIASYPKDLSQIDQAVETLRKANPKAVYLQAVSKAAIEFIQKCLAKDFHPVFLGQSALSTMQMTEALAKQPVEFYVSEVVPAATETDIPLLKNFQRDMAAIGVKDADFLAVEGYLGAAILKEALVRAGRDVTRDSLFTTLEKMTNVDIEGIRVQFGPNKHFAMDSNYLFHLKDGRLNPL